MQDYVIDDFHPALGETFELDEAGARIGLTLEKVQDLPRSVREAGSFKLQFRGPRDPLLPQAIYRFARGGETWEIFIVPIWQDEDSTTYEAVFN